MSKGKREALELAEASRDPLDDRGSFASNLFVGRYDFARIHPYPEQSAEDRAAGEEFLGSLEKYLSENVDADEIDRTGEIPQKNIDGLFAMGAFGVKIPKQYGGLGLSQVKLWTGGHVARELGRKSHCARFCASIDRRSATVAALRHRRTKEKISAAGRAQRDFRVRADGMERRFGSREHELARRSDRRRFGVHPQRREALVHEL